MIVQVAGGNGVFDGDLRVVAEVDARARHETTVQGVELVWVLVRPQGKPRHAPDHHEGILKCVGDIATAEPVFVASQRRDLRLALSQRV